MLKKDSYQIAAETAKLLLEVTSAHRKRFEARRSYQWKVNLALWAALGITLGQIIVAHGTSDAFGPQTLWLSIPFALVFAGMMVQWLRGHSKHGMNDRVLAARGLERVATILDEKAAFNGDSAEESKDAKTGGNCDATIKEISWYSHCLEMGITVLLLAATVIVAAIPSSKQADGARDGEALRHHSSVTHRSVLHQDGVTTTMPSTTEEGYSEE